MVELTIGVGNVMTNFLPLMRNRGVSEQQIQQMTVENPARPMAYDARQARSTELDAASPERE